MREFETIDPVACCGGVKGRYTLHVLAMYLSVASCSIISIDVPSTEREKGEREKEPSRMQVSHANRALQFHRYCDNSAGFNWVTRARGSSESNDLEELTAAVVIYTWELGR